MIEKVNQLATKHLLGINDLSVQEIELIFDTAINFKQLINRPVKKVPSLRDITIANVFFENSTRTKLSFELAQKRLGADVINFASSSSSVSKGETLLDTVNNLLAMKVDMIVLRHPNPGSAQFLAQNVNASVINAGDGTHEHPTQALLDAFSILEHYPKLEGLKILQSDDKSHYLLAAEKDVPKQPKGASLFYEFLMKDDFVLYRDNQKSPPNIKVIYKNNDGSVILNEEIYNYEISKIKFMLVCTPFL
jgi:aspartate carbamoyltransferase catalytic subunit